jgi:hypothetical protein
MLCGESTELKNVVRIVNRCPLRFPAACQRRGVSWSWHLNDKCSALVSTAQPFIDLIPGKMLPFQLKSVFLARFITANALSASLCEWSAFRAGEKGRPPLSLARLRSLRRVCRARVPRRSRHLGAATTRHAANSPEAYVSVEVVKTTCCRLQVPEGIAAVTLQAAWRILPRAFFVFVFSPVLHFIQFWGSCKRR